MRTLISGRVKAFGILLLWGLGLGACAPQTGALVFVGPQVEGVRQFHVVDLADDSRRQLLTGVGGLGTTFLWMSGGEQAVVYREADRNYYLTNLEAGSLGNCLTCSNQGLTSPALSPNGEQLAWNGPDGIYMQEVASREIRRLAQVERPGWVNWSPDGRQLAFAARDGTLQVYLLEVSTGQLTPLTEAGERGVESFAPAWSPRRDQIAYHSLDQDGLHLMVIDADGEDPTSLANWQSPDEIYDPGLQAPPTWSPDGSSLLFAAASPAGDLDLFSVGADGEGLRNLTGSPGDDWDPAWSPSGKLIAFVSERDGDQEIYLINADGSEPRNLSQLPTTPESNPAWRP